MRVCVVSRELAPFTGWGVGTYAANMARALAEAGHETHLLTAPAPGLAAAAEPLPGVRVHTIDRARPPSSLRHVPCRATQGPLAIFQTLRVLHERHPFDFIEFTDVYAEGYFAVQARRTLGLFDRAVMAVRLHSPIFLLRRINRQHAIDADTACVEHMEAATIGGADLILGPSRAILDEVRGVLPRTGAAGGSTGLDDRTRVRGARAAVPVCEVLPYPFDPGLFSAAHASDVGSATDRSDVLFVGRIEYRKGVHLLVEAAQRLLGEGAAVRVRVIGVDTATAPGGRSMTEWLRSRVEPRFADRFAFEPNRPRADLAAAMRGAAVCVVPSLWENFPFTLLEAMSLGCCVVAAGAGGIPEIVRGGIDGLLFAPGDAGGLADQLRTALADAPLRARLAGAAPGRVADLCNPRSIIGRLETLVEQSRRTRRERGDRGASAEIAGRGDTPVPCASGARVPRAARTSSVGSVSVLVPFYNLVRCLPECLDSIRAQTVAPEEIILIDDGSTDPEARALVDRLEAAPPPRFRVVRQANRGLAAARNAGLRAAGSRWVLPLDADDALAPTFVERALEAAARNPDAVLVTSWMSCFEDAPERPALLFVPIGFDRDLLCAANVASSCTALLERGVVLGAGGYDESLPAFEDWDLYCRLAERLAGDDVPLSERAVVVPEPLILNRIRPDSMLRRMTPAVRRELHATILAKHPGLAADASRVARMLLGGRAEPAPAPGAAAHPVVPAAPPLVARLGRRLRRWSGA